MLTWNQESQQLLKSYLDTFLAWEKSAPAFYILSWPEHIGKSSFVQELAKQYLGDFFYNDFLHIKDFSQILGKKHILKVQYNKGNEISKTLLDDYEYLDLGMREITHRLQQSYVNTSKILLLENIERLNEEAANAFLKSCEEPLPGRIIIATTSHASQLIDTIISRALVIHFNALSPEELLKFADEQNLFTGNKAFKELACDMAMGKPGILLTLHELFTEDEELRQQISEIIPLLSEKKQLFKAHDILKNFKKNGILDTFLDGWIAYTANHAMIEQSKHRMKVKRMMKAPVNVEHLMMYGLLQ